MSAHYEGEVVSVWLSDGRNMELREAFAYIDAADLRWDVPKGRGWTAHQSPILRLRCLAALREFILPDVSMSGVTLVTMLTVSENEGTTCMSDVIEKLFVHRDAIARHLSAPLVRERQAYLSKLLAAGYNRQLVADRASTLCHIATRGWFAQSEVTEEDIFGTLVLWVGKGVPQDSKTLRYRGKQFVAVARHWTRFLGTYVPSSG